MRVSRGHNLVAVCCVALFGLLRLTSLVGGTRTAEEAAGGGPGFETAETRVYYRISNEQQVRFPLAPQDETVKLVAILEWPRARLSSAEAARVPFAIEVQLLDDTRRLLWQGRLWVQTKKTRKRVAGAAGTLEPAFYASGPQSLLDPRILTLPVRRLAQHAAILSVRLAEPASAGAVLRCFRCQRLEDPDPLGAWNRMPYETRLGLSRGNLFDPSLISDEERLQLVSQRWTFILPEGDAGVDFTPLAIYRTAHELFDDAEFDLPLLATSLLSPERQLAWNVEGPGTLELLARPEPGVSTSGRARIQTQLLDLEGSPQVLDHPLLLLPNQLDPVKTFTLAPGPNTLTVRALEGRCQVTARLLGTARPALFDHPPGTPDAGEKPSATAAPDLEARIIPFEKQTGYWLLCGSREAAQACLQPRQAGAREGEIEVGDPEEFFFAIPPRQNPEENLYRLRIRGLLPRNLPVAVPISVQVQYLAELPGAGQEAKPLATYQLQAQAPADPSVWHGDGDMASLVGGQTQYFLKIPSEAGALRIRASRPCLVQLSARVEALPFEVQVPQDYRAGKATRLKSKGEEGAQTWFAVEPAQYVAAHQAGRVVRLHASLPLVVPRQEEAASGFPLRGIPAQNHAGASQVLWPPTLRPPLRFPIDWSVQSYVRLGADEESRVRLPMLFRLHPSEPYPLRVLSRSPGAALGIRDEAAGRDLLLFRPGSGSDAASLSLRGAQARLRAAPGGEVFANLLPEAPDPTRLWRLAEGFRATRERPAVFEVEKHSQAPLALSLTLCATGWDPLPGPGVPGSGAGASGPPGARAEVVDLEAPGGAAQARRYRALLEIEALRPPPFDPTAAPPQVFTFRRRLFTVQCADLGFGTPLFLGPAADPLSEAAAVFAPLEEDLPPGPYRVTLKPLGDYALWVKAAARGERPAELPPGRDLVWHLKGPDVVRVRWRPADPGRRKVVVPLEAEAATPLGLLPLRGALDPTEQAAGWLARQYLLPEGLLSLYVRNPARLGEESGVKVEVECLRRQGSSPSAKEFRILEIDQQSPWLPLDDEIDEESRWPLRGDGKGLAYSLPAEGPGPSRDGPQDLQLRIEFRTFQATLPPRAPEAPAPQLPAGTVAARLLDESGRLLAESSAALGFPEESTAWAKSDGRALSGAVERHLLAPPQARRLELRFTPAPGRAAEQPLLVGVASRWREAPPVHLLQATAVRRSRISFQAPQRFFPEWQPVLPEWNREGPAGQAGPLAIRLCRPVFLPVPEADWQRLAESEGRELEVRPPAGSASFLEPSYLKAGDPPPWSPSTFARITEGPQHAISVLPPEGAGEQVAFQDLNLRYELPGEFDPQKPIAVWLNGKKAAAQLPRTASGSLVVRDLKPGKHLLRVETGQPQAELFVNALPTENLGSLRFKSRAAFFVGPGGQVELVCPRPEQAAQVIHVPLYLAAEQPRLPAGQQHIEVEAELLGYRRIPASGRLLEGATRLRRRFLVPLEDPDAQFFSTGGKARYWSAGMLFFPLMEDLQAGEVRLRLNFPPGLDLLIRPFTRLAKDPAGKAFLNLEREALPGQQE